MMKRWDLARSPRLFRSCYVLDLAGVSGLSVQPVPGTQ